jgi:hypothetical protein
MATHKHLAKFLLISPLSQENASLIFFKETSHQSKTS